jgi:hypothetical protein
VFFPALVSNCASIFCFDLTMMFPSDDSVFDFSAAIPAAVRVVTVDVSVVRVVGVLLSAPSRVGRKQVEA